MRVVCPYCFTLNSVPKKDEYKKANCGQCKESLLFCSVLELYEANFDEVVLNSQLPVVVYFWASWSQPCEKMTKEYKLSALQFPLKALFAQVDLKDEHTIAQKYDVRSAPTIIIFKDSVEAYRVSGALKSEGISSLINSFL